MITVYSHGMGIKSVTKNLKKKHLCNCFLYMVLHLKIVIIVTNIKELLLIQYNYFI